MRNCSPRRRLGSGGAVLLTDKAVGSNPGRVPTGGNQSMLLPHTDVSVPPSQINKHVLR